MIFITYCSGLHGVAKYNCLWEHIPQFWVRYFTKSPTSELKPWRADTDTLVCNINMGYTRIRGNHSRLHATEGALVAKNYLFDYFVRGVEPGNFFVCYLTSLSISA